MKSIMILVLPALLLGTNAFAQGRSGFGISQDGKTGPGYTQPSTLGPDDIVDRSEPGEIRNAEYSIKMDGRLQVTLAEGAICDQAFTATGTAAANFKELGMIAPNGSIEIPLPVGFYPTSNATYGGYSKPVNTNIRITANNGCITKFKISSKGMVPLYTKYFETKQANPLGKKLWDLFCALNTSIVQN